jgi:hypothetical protein
MYIAEEQNRWDEYLSQIMMAYRSSKQSSTGQIPNMLKLGRKVTFFSLGFFLLFHVPNAYEFAFLAHIHSHLVLPVFLLGFL